jgi:2,4-dienoyl-CoA reductase-like NADH-dependent reductase (Old Yellow Enzyme family)
LSETKPLRTIWSPVQLGPVTLKNRISVPPISTYYAGGERFLNERHIAYYRERAYGGVGLIVTEQQLADSRTGFRSNCLIVWDEEAIPGLTAAGEAVHEHGAKLFVELLVPGAWDTGLSSLEDWHVPRGPSRMFIDYVGEHVDQLTKADIRQLAVDLGRSADNVRRAGLDGVDIHGAHGYLAQQFFSRILNTRTDEYGGSARNRSRFVIEAGQAIRDRVGAGLALGLRVSIEEYRGPQGVTEAEMLEILDIVADEGLYDFFDISCGGLGSVHRTISPMGTEEGFLAGQGKHVKEMLAGRAKTILVGRVRSLDLAERLVSEGAADLVHMGRAHLAEPLLVRKALEGQTDETVRCIGISACAGGQPMVNCILNPITGRERQWGAEVGMTATSDRKKVVVIGGGPAGLRFAGTAAKRGHSVTLLERSTQLGGMLNQLATPPTRGDWRMAIEDLQFVAGKYGVEFQLQSTASAEAVAALSPDVVVCAAGARWSDGDHSTNARQDRPRLLDLGAALESVARDAMSLGKRVVIRDETGRHLPLGLAEMLAAARVRVWLVTAKTGFGQQMSMLDVPYLFPRLAQAGIEMLSQHRIVSSRQGRVSLAGVWGGRITRRLSEVDTVVVTLPKVPDDTLYDTLVSRFATVHRIGDALSPRTVREAMFEGEKLAREI